MMATVNKPLMIFDGDCNFCRYFIGWWERATGTMVDYAPSQEVGDDFPEIAKERFDGSIQLVVPDGMIYEGAEAVFRALGYAKNWRWLLWIYQNIPGVEPITEWVYKWVAANRQLLSRWTCWLWKKNKS
jgi:predicted DCC family thiol-disulfide oxidoreductase YuxK